MCLFQTLLEYPADLHISLTLVKLIPSNLAYLRWVRTYLQNQHQQEYEKQYSERKRTQQWKKDMLE